VPPRRPSDPQLSLFAEDELPASHPVHPAEVPEELVELGARMPAGLHLGTSSWSFPGWQGIVWEGHHSSSVLAREGLSAYARHPLLTGVGLDRTYYQPLDADELAEYREQVPEELRSRFRFVVKAHELLTLARFPDHERYGTQRGEANGYFLDEIYALEAVVEPMIEGLQETAGALVFQFAPQDLGKPLEFIEKLFLFLDGLPRVYRGHEPIYAVEIRNREVLVPQYALALADAGAVPCLNVHPRMPEPDVQWRAITEVARPERGALVARWMLQPGQSYDGARQRYEPFDRLVDPDPRRRGMLADLAREALAREEPVFLTVNNKAEGSAPLSVFELARALTPGPSPSTASRTPGRGE
jgi:uncharacterized protein YecE (DUF72 family)